MIRVSDFLRHPNGVQEAFDVGSGNTILVDVDCYVSETLLVDSATTVIGESAEGGRAKIWTDKAIPIMRNKRYPLSNSCISISNINLDCCGVGSGIEFKECDWLYLDAVWSINSAAAGITLDTCNAVNVNNSRAYNCCDGIKALNGSCHTYTNFNGELLSGAGVLISEANNTSSFSSVGCYFESTAYGIKADARGLNVLGGRSNAASVADIYFSDTAAINSGSVIGMSCVSVGPSIGNIFIGENATGLTLISNTGTVVCDADSQSVVVVGMDQSGNHSLKGVTLDGTSGISNVGSVSGLEFKDSFAKLWNNSGNFEVLAQSVGANIRAGGNIGLFPGSSGMVYSSRPITLAPVDFASAPQNSIFVDSGDGKVKFKDNLNITHELY